MAPRMSYAEYAAFERESAIKHEYLRGEVFAMAGGSPPTIGGSPRCART